MVVGNTHPARAEDKSNRDEQRETGNLYQVQLQIGGSRLRYAPRVGGKEFTGNSKSRRMVITVQGYRIRLIDSASEIMES